MSSAGTLPVKLPAHGLRSTRNTDPRAPSTLLGVDLITKIETRPGVRSGKPCFVGTLIVLGPSEALAEP